MITCTVLAMVFFYTGAAALHAQSGGGFDLTWNAIAGGGRASGGAYTLDAAIGQPEAGTVSGGGFALTGGFWNRAIAAPPLGSPTPTKTPAVSRVDLPVILSTWP
jgi:hypothetical protein